MLLRPLLSPAVSLAATAAPAAFGLPVAVNLRGGAAAAAAVGGAAFDMGLAKTRLEGLAYSTVTTLLMGAALSLFSSTPKFREAIPEDADKAKVVKFNNNIKFIFGLCVSLSVALGAYTTTIYALLAIYSKTALGMGLQADYMKLFDKFTFYRVWGFRAFIGTILTYNVGWILSLILRYEGEDRWYMALPAILIGVAGLFHYRSIMTLAGSILYS